MSPRKQILILEDEDNIQEFLKIQLLEINFDGIIFQAKEKGEAYQIAIENKIDLFLIDIILKKEKREDISGVEFAQNIRKIEYYELTPIIFITSMAAYERQVFHNIHCYDYLTKPIDIEKLKKALENVLKPRESEEKDKKHLNFVADSIIYPIQVKDIIYVEYEKRTLKVYTINEKITVKNLSLSECAKKAQNTSILQINKNVLINSNYIRYFDFVNRILELNINGKSKEFEVGQTFKARLKEYLNI